MITTFVKKRQGHHSVNCHHCTLLGKKNKEYISKAMHKYGARSKEATALMGGG
jgi:uncharacterized C2H2 Zn-finger protein